MTQLIWLFWWWKEIPIAGNFFAANKFFSLLCHMHNCKNIHLIRDYCIGIKTHRQHTVKLRHVKNSADGMKDKK